MPQRDYHLTLSCEDRPGIVAAVSSHLFQSGANILESSQYHDPEENRFFMRITFAVGAAQGVVALKTGLDALRQQYGMEVRLVPVDERSPELRRDRACTGVSGRDDRDRSGYRHRPD